jgi:ATP-binding cassette subfamily C protein
MSALFMDVLKFSPAKMLVTLLLMLFRNVSAGVSLLLILPLLQIIGFSLGPDTTYGITKKLTTVFQCLHLPLNLFTILLSYVSLVSIIAIAAYGEQMVSTSLQQQYIHHLRGRLYSHILHTTWPFFLQQKISNLLHTLTTQIQFISTSNFQLLTLLNHLILLGVYTFIAFLLSWQMTCVAILCALLLLSIMLPLHRLTSQAGHYHLQKNQAIMQSLAEQLSALKMIKGSGAENTFVNETQRISASLEQQNQRLTYVTAMTKLVYTIGSVIIFSALLYLSINVLAISLSSLLLLLVVFSRLLPMVSTIQQSYQRILHQLPSYRDVKHLLQDCLTHQEIVDDKNQRKPIFNDAITLKNISFSYLATKPIIRDLSLCLEKNTTTAIIGPSGVGKSTLADLIVGLLEPTAGEIYIDQQILDNHHKLAWRKSVAYVTQDNFLFNTSIRENLQLLSKDQSDKALWAALQSAAAAEFVAKLEQGLDTIIGDRGIRLSGGERQRIALARALLMKPQLLVLDESTSSLDKQTIIYLQETLIQLQGKMTIIIISHQAEMSQYVNQRIVLTSKNVGKLQTIL